MSHNEDHERMDRMSEILHLSAEKTRTMHNFLDAQLKSIETEDPDELIPCSCCGEFWPAKDVDVWGNCPATRGE